MDADTPSSVELRRSSQIDAYDGETCPFFGPLPAAPVRGKRDRSLQRRQSGLLSPDGEHLAFDSDRDGDYEIHVVELASGVVRRLTRNGADDRWPAWSPDGTQMVFASQGPEGFGLSLLT